MMIDNLVVLTLKRVLLPLITILLVYLLSPTPASLREEQWQVVYDNGVWVAVVGDPHASRK